MILGVKNLNLINFVTDKVTDKDYDSSVESDFTGSNTYTKETGLEIKVPLFIEVGEMIKIDTRTGEYLSRA